MSFLERLTSSRRELTVESITAHSTDRTATIAMMIVPTQLGSSCVRSFEAFLTLNPVKEVTHPVTLVSSPQDHSGRYYYDSRYEGVACRTDLSISMQQT